MFPFLCSSSSSFIPHASSQNAADGRPRRRVRGTHEAGPGRPADTLEASPSSPAPRPHASVSEEPLAAVGGKSAGWGVRGFAAAIRDGCGMRMRGGRRSFLMEPPAGRITHPPSEGNARNHGYKCSIQPLQQAVSLAGSAVSQSSTTTLFRPLPTYYAQSGVPEITISILAITYVLFCANAASSDINTMANATQPSVS